MPENYDVEVRSLDVPGMNLVAGASRGVTTDTLSPRGEYTITATIEMIEVPGTFGTDHCQSGTNGGARIVMEAINNAGSKTVDKCISGPPGQTTDISITMEAPSEPGQTDRIDVDFFGEESREFVADTTSFEIETAESGGGGDADDVDVEIDVAGINVPGRSLLVGAEVGVQDEIDSGESYTISTSAEATEVPELGDADCTGPNGERGVEIEMVVESELVNESVIECVHSGGVDFEIEVAPTARDGYVDTVYVDFYDAVTGDRVADTTIFEIEIVNMTDREEDFDLDSVDSSCDISSTDIETGEVVEVDIDLDGFSPDTETYDVGVLLLANDEVIAEGEGRVTPNGAGGESFEIEFDSPGEYEIDYELKNLGSA